MFAVYLYLGPQTYKLKLSAKILRVFLVFFIRATHVCNTCSSGDLRTPKIVL